MFRTFVFRVLGLFRVSTFGFFAFGIRSEPELARIGRSGGRERVRGMSLAALASTPRVSNVELRASAAGVSRYGPFLRYLAPDNFPRGVKTVSARALVRCGISR